MRRQVITVVAFAILALILPAHAQQSGKPVRIGFLSLVQPQSSYLAGFRNGMRDLGHKEGKSYVLIPGWGTLGA